MATEFTDTVSVALKMAVTGGDPLDPGGLMVVLGDDQKNFVVIVGLFEFNAIQIGMEDLNLPRPLTHDLFPQLFNLFGLKPERMIITKLQDDTFYACMIIKGPDGVEKKLDIRPSDMLAIVLRCGANMIEVTREVYDQVKDVTPQIEELKRREETDKKEG